MTRSPLSRRRPPSPAGTDCPTPTAGQLLAGRCRRAAGRQRPPRTLRRAARSPGRGSPPAATPGRRPRSDRSARPAALRPALEPRSPDAARRPPRHRAGGPPTGAATSSTRPTGPDQLGRLGRYEVLRGDRPRRHGRRAQGVRPGPAAASWRSRCWPRSWPPAPTARTRFAREARGGRRRQPRARRRHPRASTRPTGLPYLVMQYVAGQSLQERLDRDGPLASTEVAAHRHAGRRRAWPRPTPRGWSTATSSRPNPAGERRRAGQADRLRPGPGRRRRQPDAERRRRRHAAVHGPGAGPRRGGRPPRRPVQPRQRALRRCAPAARRSAARRRWPCCAGSPRRRRRPLREVNPDVPGLAGRRHRPAARQGPGRPVPDGRRGGRPTSASAWPTCNSRPTCRCRRPRRRPVPAAARAAGGWSPPCWPWPPSGSPRQPATAACWSQPPRCCGCAHGRGHPGGRDGGPGGQGPRRGGQGRTRPDRDGLPGNPAAARDVPRQGAQGEKQVEDDVVTIMRGGKVVMRCPGGSGYRIAGRAAPATRSPSGCRSSHSRAWLTPACRPSGSRPPPRRPARRRPFPRAG